MVAVLSRATNPHWEDIHVNSEADKVRKRTYSVTMKLKKDIPQFLPMHEKNLNLLYFQWKQAILKVNPHRNKFTFTPRTTPQGKLNNNQK